MKRDSVIPVKPESFPVKFICHTKHYDNVRLVREGMDRLVKEREFDAAVDMGVDKKNIPMSPLFVFYFIDGEDVEIPTVTKQDADEAFAKHILEQEPAGERGYELPKDEPEDEPVGPSVVAPAQVPWQGKKRGRPAKGK